MKIIVKIAKYLIAKNVMKIWIKMMLFVKAAKRDIY